MGMKQGTGKEEERSSCLWVLKKTGEKPKDDFSRVLFYGITNYRGWTLALTYRYCFGIELTVDNIIAKYFYDRFDLKLHTTGMIAASFGLANVVSRPAGGMISDAMGKRFGMRVRLWALWICQTLGGLFCVILGLVGSLSASLIVMIIFSVFVQAACGLTFGVVFFVSRRQLDYFQEYQQRVGALIGAERAQQLVNKALVLMTVGGNDFVNNYYLVPNSTRSQQFALPDYVKYLISMYKKHLQRLYDLGARRVLVTGTGPLGCMPVEMALRITTVKCSAELQRTAALFNPPLVQRMQHVDMFRRSWTFFLC